MQHREGSKAEPVTENTQDMVRERIFPVFLGDDGEVGVNSRNTATVWLLHSPCIDYLGVDVRRYEGRSAAERCRQIFSREKKSIKRVRLLVQLTPPQSTM